MGKKNQAGKTLKVSSPSQSSHSRTILAIVLVALVLALVIVFVKIAADKKELNAQPTNTIPGTKALIGYAEPTTYAEGRGIWLKGGKVLSNDEVASEAKAGTKTMELYYDYLCNACNDVEEALDNGKQLEDLVEGGKAMVVLRPTLTHGGQLGFPNFAFSANNLMYWVAENQPDKLWDLSKDLSKFALDNYKSADYEANQNNEQWSQTLRNPDAKLTEIAKKHGIDYAKVPPATEQSGALPIQIMAAMRLADLGRDAAATPMYIANGHIIDMSKLGQDHKLLENATL